MLTFHLEEQEPRVKALHDRIPNCWLSLPYLTLWAVLKLWPEEPKLTWVWCCVGILYLPHPCSSLPEQKLHVKEWIVTPLQQISGKVSLGKRLPMCCPLKTLWSSLSSHGQKRQKLSLCALPRAQKQSCTAQQQSAVGSLTGRGFLTDQISLIHFMTFTDFVCSLIFTVLLSREMNSFVYGNELHRSVFYYVKRQRFLWAVSTSTVKLDRTKFAKH